MNRNIFQKVCFKINFFVCLAVWSRLTPPLLITAETTQLLFISITKHKLCKTKSKSMTMFTDCVSSYQCNTVCRPQDVAAAAVVAMLPTFWVASFFAWWACSTATASSTCKSITRVLYEDDYLLHICDE